MPIGYGFYGWDGPDYRERDGGCAEHLRYEC